jgi:hypothetical protein
MNELIYQFTIHKWYIVVGDYHCTIHKWYIVVGDYHCTTLLLFCLVIIRHLFCNNGFSPDMEIMYCLF